jgi:hypothetical protein
MCYSVRDGFEGMIARVKNEPSKYGWLKYPLGSLLYSYMQRHLGCIENAYGGSFDLKVTVPSSKRRPSAGNHLDELIGCIRGMSSEWEGEILRKVGGGEAASRRNKIVEDMFLSSPSVSGKRVLILDDTFTSGGTVASAAYALKSAGATAVVACTFGRQLDGNWKESAELISSLPSRALDLSTCAVHGLSAADLFIMR